MEITWIAHSCFEIDAGDVVVYTDPYEVPGGLPKATLILLSHEHYDHADMPSIETLRGPGTVVICPKTCAGKFKALVPVGLDPGDVTSVGAITIAAVPAYTFTGKPFHPKEKKWNGYVIEIQGKTLYHAGDCDIMEEMKALASRHIDVAFLPVGDKGFTMDFKDAAKAAAWIKPTIVVPMHDWNQDLAPFVKFASAEAPGVKVEVLKKRKLVL
nr:MBL fold metallo-hydrolase [Candidatus Sigynarchaeota archaeon]